MMDSKEGKITGAPSRNGDFGRMRKGVRAMKEKVLLATISATVGGFMGAMMVLFFSGGDRFEQLEVGQLTVREKISLRPAEAEKDQVVIKDGGLLAKNRIVAGSVLSDQLAGRFLLTNRVLTTPDDPSGPVEKCRLYTEMGSNPETGGAMIIRSPGGSNIIGQGIEGGHAICMGYNPQGSPLFYMQNNENGQRAFGVLASADRDGASESNDSPNSLRKSPSSTTTAGSPSDATSSTAGVSGTARPKNPPRRMLPYEPSSLNAPETARRPAAGVQ
jgi:hypothetical protein